MTIKVQASGIKELQQSLGNSQKKMPGQLNSAINKTLKFTVSQKAKSIAKRINMSQSKIKKLVKQSKSTPTSLTAVSTLIATQRPSLTEFTGTRQTKKGVSYKIDKTKGRQIVPGGFMGPRPGVKAPKLNGHAFKRKGVKRKPITRLDGVSPWAIYVINKMNPALRKMTQERLAKEIQNKVRVNILRSQGLI